MGLQDRNYDRGAVEAELGKLCAKWAVPAQINFSRRMTSTMGTADCSRATITLSDHIASTSEAIDTVRHEFAHLLNHELHGHSAPPHGKMWRECAVRVGARPKRTGPAGSMIRPVYECRCLSCGFVHTSHTRRLNGRTVSCGNCESHFTLEWKLASSQASLSHDRTRFAQACKRALAFLNSFKAKWPHHSDD